MGIVAAILFSAATASAQIPDPTKAINAAKDAKAKSEAASQGKNQPQPPAQPAPPPAGAPGAPGASGAQAAPQGAQAEKPPPAAGDQPGYSYDPAGRRDPFISLLGRGAEVPTPGGARPSGLAGVLISEVTLKGVFRSPKGEFIALLQTPDNRTHIGRSGDKVMDGSIKAITQDAVVFSQDVNDPLSLVKQREVRKTIRPEAR